MFLKLKKKWNVSGTAFFYIFSTFAVTGTVTAWVSRYVTSWLDVETYSASWWLLKIGVLLIGYQLFLLFFGFLFGQFSFFWKYEKKILTKIGLLRSPHILNIAIFASGGGSNARMIIEHFTSPSYKGIPVKISMIVCNNPHAGVLEIAKAAQIDPLIINKQTFFSEKSYLQQLKNIDFIVLAGFLWKIPESLIKAFPKRIVNIHPALLPKYGGKGMYGHHVHEAVVLNKEKESGITIHYVDEHYDNGDVIFQKKCEINEMDDAVSVAKKVLALEHQYYPQVIESVIKAKSTLKD